MLKKLSNKIKRIVFIVEGGIGKNIMATAVVSKIKEKYSDKKLVIVTAYPDIYLYNPKVSRVYNMSNAVYFYDDNIGEDTIVIKVEPYLSYDYLNQNKHLMRVWCDVLGLECSEMPQPELFFTKDEYDMAFDYVGQITGGWRRPLVMFQWIGGLVPADASTEEIKKAHMMMARRFLDKELAQEIVEKLVKEGNTIVEVALPNFPRIERVLRVNTNLRQVLVLLKYAKTFVGIDSFLQHASATKSLFKKGVVLWGATNPKCLGYEHNVNLENQCELGHCNRPNSFLYDILPNGQFWSCPYNYKCVDYKADMVIDKVKEVLEKDKVISEVDVIKEKK